MMDSSAAKRTPIGTICQGRIELQANSLGRLYFKRHNAQVNRQKCEAFLSVLNLQLGWCA